MGLSQDVAALEQARADGKLPGRDLEVISRQIDRAETKILNMVKASALGGRVRTALGMGQD